MTDNYSIPLDGSFAPRNLPEAIIYADRAWGPSHFIGYMIGYMHGTGIDGRSGSDWSKEHNVDIFGARRPVIKWAKRMIDEDRCLRCEERRLDHAADLSCYTQGPDKFRSK